ncbi:MAG: hypothetical protein WC781_05620 [Candidatus Pacearchaeota archaeon]|jgi:hypothetical protein
MEEQEREILKQMIAKLLSFMTDEQIEEASCWLEEMNEKLEMLNMVKAK